MKESINGLWFMSIMIVFMAIFIAFVCIQMNYSNAYRLKSDMVTYIEEYQGMNATSQNAIDSLIKKYGYISRGKCRIEEGHTVYGITNGSGENANRHPNKKYQYCVSIEKKNKGHSGDSELHGSLDKYYYTVELFFGFGLPGLGDIYTFRTSGETNGIIYPNEKLFDLKNDKEDYVT